MNGERPAPTGPIGGVYQNTRTLAPRELFLQLKGERFDAARFLGQAFCAWCLRYRGSRGTLASGGQFQPTIVVDDARAALGRLAAPGDFALRCLWLVTQRNGKTTVKEMSLGAARACADASTVIATQGNLNNDIGVPLTLLGLRASTVTQ